MPATIECETTMAVMDNPMPRKLKNDKLETRQARLGAEFISKLSVIANAMSRMLGREVTIAEAAEARLGDSLEVQFEWAMQQLGKMRKDKPKPKA